MFYTESEILDYLDSGLLIWMPSRVLAPGKADLGPRPEKVGYSYDVFDSEQFDLLKSLTYKGLISWSVEFEGGYYIFGKRG